MQSTLEKWHIQGVAIAVLDGDDTWSEVCSSPALSTCKLTIERVMELLRYPMCPSDPPPYSMLAARPSPSQRQRPRCSSTTTKNTLILNGRRRSASSSERPSCYKTTMLHYTSRLRTHCPTGRACRDIYTRIYVCTIPKQRCDKV